LNPIVFLLIYKPNLVCNDGTGTWSFSIVDGVTDFAYGGVPLNNNYNCFEGCLNTQTAVQDFKVSLNGTVPPTVASLPMLKAAEARLESGLVKTLLFNLNRPGWAINCVDFNDFALGTFLRDYNFCEYEAVLGQGVYWLRMALIDTA
ncbi:hypothetical protein COOONC_14135, partial [Cooperia oncophora]